MLDAKTLRQRLLALGVADSYTIAGCTDSEIQRLEVIADLRLPSAYIAFLRVAGKTAGRFMSDVDIYYDKLSKLNSRAIAILDNWEEGRLCLPHRAFVFAMRYGEQFMFFVADGQSEDPPIQRYYLEQGRFDTIASSVWDVIEGELLLLESFKKNHPDAPFWNGTKIGG
jgi:hypothetical protein